MTIVYPIWELVSFWLQQKQLFRPIDIRLSYKKWLTILRHDKAHVIQFQGIHSSQGKKSNKKPLCDSSCTS